MTRQVEIEARVVRGGTRRRRPPGRGRGGRGDQARRHACRERAARPQPRGGRLRSAGAGGARSPRPRTVRRRDGRRRQRSARNVEIGPMLDSTPDAPGRAAAHRAGRGRARPSKRAPTGCATTRRRSNATTCSPPSVRSRWRCFVLALANRWITKPLSRLADEARVMASERLPNAVNSILETPLGDDVVPPTIEPIHVRGGAEVSGAVEALNAVQESAIGLAVEQVVAAPEHRGLVRQPRSPQPEPALPPARPDHAPRAGRV